MYAYYDVNGFLMSGPSTMGWRSMRERLTGPVGRSFVAAGMTERPRQLALELAATETENVTTRRALRRLLRAAQAAERILILTDSVGVHLT